MDLTVPAAISFIITALAIPPTIKLAKKFNLIDSERAVPRAGGLAVFVGLTLSIIIFTPLKNSTIGMLASLVMLLLVGLADDKYRHLSPYFRLASQFVVGVLFVASGVGIDFITNPLGGIIHLNSVPLLPQVLAIFWIVWVMNMVNWSKGVDGQMPAITAVSAIVLGLLSLKLNIAEVAKLSFITAGSSLALLLFNWYPAKIFPGFSGSTILGFMVATLAILSGAKLATALLVLLIPATDFAYTFIRRILQGKSPVWGDRGHLHHKLLQAGLTHQQISLFYILGSVILGTAALNLSSQGKLFAAGLVASVLFGGLLWLNFFGGLSKRSDQDNG